MKRLIIFLALCFSFLFAGCTSDVQIKDEKSDTVSIEETLKYVDAYGNWHETVIDPDVPTHDYDWNRLSNDENGIFYEGDENYTIRRGIDVSKYQGRINWKKVKDDGYEFAIIRLGYRGYSESGTLNLDPYFNENIENAVTAGLDVGVYFFSQAINEEEALDEAYFVLENLEGYKLCLPIVYDPELIRNDEARTDNVTGSQFTKNTIVFCEKIKEAGYEPMIYSNMVWEATLFNMEKLKEYDFWYADYEPVPQTPYRFTMWQYSSTGKVDGIEGNVDLNIQFIPVN